MQGEVVVIGLPRPPRCRLLTTKSPDLQGKVISVRLDTSGRMDELVALLRTQKPQVLVVSALHPLSGNDVQRVTDAAFQHCANVSIVGSFSTSETFTVRVCGVVRVFCLLDSEASLRGNDVIVYGKLECLHLLHISGDCHVHLNGFLLPAAKTCIHARQMTVNGYLFKLLPVGAESNAPMHHPLPRRKLCPAILDALDSQAAALSVCAD